MPNGKTDTITTITKRLNFAVKIAPKYAISRSKNLGERHSPRPIPCGEVESRAPPHPTVFSTSAPRFSCSDPLTVNWCPSASFMLAMALPTSTWSEWLPVLFRGGRAIQWSLLQFIVDANWTSKLHTTSTVLAVACLQRMHSHLLACVHYRHLFDLAFWCQPFVNNLI